MSDEIVLDAVAYYFYAADELKVIVTEWLLKMTPKIIETMDIGVNSLGYIEVCEIIMYPDNKETCWLVGCKPAPSGEFTERFLPTEPLPLELYNFALNLKLSGII
jgi:hypothetical protein